MLIMIIMVVVVLMSRRTRRCCSRTNKHSFSISNRYSCVKRKRKVGKTRWTKRKDRNGSGEKINTIEVCCASEMSMAVNTGFAKIEEQNIYT